MNFKSKYFFTTISIFVATINFAQSAYFTHKVSHVESTSKNLKVFTLSALNSSCFATYHDITWIGKNESGLLHYIIERSLDNVNWVEVNKVKCRPHSNTEENYLYRDDFESYQQIFYRLKYRLKDGSVKVYKSVASVCKQAGDQIMLFPNPMQYELFIDFDLIEIHGLCEMKIINNKGEIKFEDKINLGIYKSNKHIYPNLPIGHYQVLIHDSKGNQVCRKSLTVKKDFE